MPLFRFRPSGCHASPFAKILLEAKGERMELSVELERPLLKQILTQYLGDLKFEISNTENYDWRQSMKRDEEVIKGLIEKLDAPDTSSEEPDRLIILIRERIFVQD
jgi:hypothetical protein